MAIKGINFLITYGFKDLYTIFDTRFPMQFTTAKVERKVEYCK